MTRTDLIAALEKAEGPSRNLDYSIRQLVGAIMPLDVAAGKNDGCWVRRIGDELVDIGSHIESGSTSRDMYLPRYTASLDAALTLVPDGWVFTLSTDDNASFPNAAAHAECADVPWASAYVNRVSDAHAATPAIALCIAALKARE